MVCASEITTAVMSKIRAWYLRCFTSDTPMGFDEYAPL